MKQYVYNGIQVKLTGQTATRKLGGRGRRPERVDTIHEIQPVDAENGSWTKWVHIQELYEINLPDSPGRPMTFSETAERQIRELNDTEEGND